MPNFIPQSQENNNVVFNQAITESLVLIRAVKSRTTTTAPGLPNSLDAYILPTGSLTGAWFGFSIGDLVYFDQGWKAIGGENPVVLNPDLTGLSPIYVEDENLYVINNAGTWETFIPAIPIYTTATKPAAADNTNGMILISDGGATDNERVLAVSDGTNWFEIDFDRQN